MKMENKHDYILDLKDVAIIDVFMYDSLVRSNILLVEKNKRLVRIIERCINYIEDDERELSVDSYYTFKDLSEFDELLEILKCGDYIDTD